jgi:hypothetical protein
MLATDYTKRPVVLSLDSGRSIRIAQHPGDFRHAMLHSGFNL